MQEAKEKVNVFWTGGFDSTFRLIQLLTTTPSQVQPHYIVRHEDSTGIEIATMIRIRRAIVRRYPDVRSRFLPTIYINEDLIPRHEDIDEKINDLQKLGKVAEQYQIMSNYCREFIPDKIEVALTSISGEKAFFNHFKNSEAFRNFEYPIVGLTKKDMLKIAKMNKWEELLYMTSFCRRPRIKIKPCGTCGPCTDAVASGMGFRLPLIARIKANLQIPVRNYWRKNYLKHNNSKLLKLVKRKFEDRF
ncbi:MAG: hypothetical protein JW965_00710 [Bacteroidales bacterium]|nr:hypothetical protein [Bacteroidales bacterium]